ncbi:MAGUK p55 subfamily member 2, partial [Geodia barretti]
MATNGMDYMEEGENVPNTKEVFQGLQGVLERLRGETFTWDEDINFVQETLADPDFLQLCEVNDGVAESQSFEQPVASLEDAMKEVFESLQMQSDEERDLHTTLSRPHMQKLMSVHDIVRSRSYETPVPQFDPTWHPQTNYDRHVKRGKGKTPEYRTVGLHKSANEPLGITLKLASNHLIIARILFGGIIHRQGLLKVGDRIVEVNGESVDSMSPSEFQAMMQNSSGSVVIKVEPRFQENAGATELYVRAHFDYNPKQDRLIPSQDAGLPFKKGDILTIMNQEDSFWWQAIRYGEHDLAKLIPSQMLEERRKAYQTHDGSTFVSCLGKRKQKKKIIYSSHHSGEFEGYDIVLYEPVLLKENFQYGTLVLIGKWIL